MADGDHLTIPLTPAELRAVAAFAARCASPALSLFERDRPGDGRPREAVVAAAVFAGGGRRVKAIRDAAWAAMRAARDARDAGAAAADHAALAAVAAAGACFLHPLAKATQVRHVLGSAAHAARAFELDAGGDAGVGDAHASRSAATADAVVADVLRRYPPAPAGGGRVGALVRLLDAAVRGTAGA